LAESRRASADYRRDSALYDEEAIAAVDKFRADRGQTYQGNAPGLEARLINALRAAYFEKKAAAKKWSCENTMRMCLVALLVTATVSAQSTAPQKPKYPALPSETPAEFKPVTDDFDFVRRDVMIPMRDSVRLHTVILVPKIALGKTSAPILLTRTPYNATALTSHAESSHLGSVLFGYDNATDVIVEGGYIRVVQDVRGKYGSEGDYVMNRPLRGPLNPTPVDHATDTYDTIDWLVKNVPESNGKVGILGISYDGFLPLMALFHPHPALKVSVPMNPMVDGWMGDDWFHNGAFRQFGLGFIYSQEATRSNDVKWWSTHADDYDEFMRGGSAGEMGRRRGLKQLGFWQKIVEHPAYDAFWREQAVDKLLAKEPLTVPVMLVHSLWDQEDIYGAISVYKAIEPKDTANDKVFLVMGPWYHGQEIGDGSTLGPLRFGSDTALYFRQRLLRPLSEGRRRGPSHRAGHGVRDRHQRVAEPDDVARGLRRQLRGEADAALPRSAPDARLRSAAPGRCAVRRIHFRSRQAGAVSGASDSEQDVVAVAGDRSTRSLRPARRARVRVGSARDAGEDQRATDGESRCVNERHRFGLGGEARRRLPRPGARTPGTRRLSARGVDGHLPWPLPRGLRDGEGDNARHAAAVRVGTADGEPRIPGGPSAHGAGAIELVPALRPQSADVRAQHLLCVAGRLSQGDAARLSCAESGQLHRAAAG